MPPAVQKAPQQRQQQPQQQKQQQKQQHAQLCGTLSAKVPALYAKPRAADSLLIRATIPGRVKPAVLSSGNQTGVLRNFAAAVMPMRKAAHATALQPPAARQQTAPKEDALKVLTVSVYAYYDAASITTQLIAKAVGPPGLAAEVGQQLDSQGVFPLPAPYGDGGVAGPPATLTVATQPGGVPDAVFRAGLVKGVNHQLSDEGLAATMAGLGKGARVAGVWQVSGLEDSSVPMAEDRLVVITIPWDVKSQGLTKFLQLADCAGVAGTP
ncbi:hypothetical protein COO60DRAFT_1677569 [Scenedesmus sp. NREL 46B-D3]|nr:hypothetical protein COO60DRAFT_1677569 [Scenedesmus sp. NREL 46B-D3]